MFHTVERNERACSTQTCLAMDGDCFLLRLGVLEEFSDDLVRWGGSIEEVQIQVLYAVFRELCLVVLWLIESHHQSHIHLFEDGHIVLGRERPISISDIEWSGERHEFAWKNPVQISVLNFFEVLVLLDIKSCIVIPAKSYRVLETLEAVQIDAFIGASSHRGIPVRQEFILVRLKSRPSLVC